MQITDNRSEVKGKAFRFVEHLSRPVYILGTNKYGMAVASWLNSLGYSVGGFINDFTGDTLFGEYPIVHSGAGKFSDAVVINCIVEGRTIDAARNILQMGAHDQIDYFALQLAYSGELMQVDFLDDTNSIPGDADRYERLQQQLADEESKKSLEGLINFRLNRDIQFLEPFQFRLKDQYFEPFVQLGDCPAFVDGGGFDGETTKSFTRLRPDYKTVYYFEPNEISFQNSRKNLGDPEGVIFFQKGLWHRQEKLVFDNSLGSASKLSESGSSYIETIALDEVVSSRVDLIKLDIEGAEFNALKGAMETIIRYKPALAVCVYHNQKDFLRIPELVLSYHPEYKIYLRHYTQGVFETVMYFV